ncbi:MAG: DUF1552 domain-containing protein, partial [Gammaproteobacteria bacterium]|nr:DUF1552 domain-containing protein [Gammaproteobacteria bacterium]
FIEVPNGIMMDKFTPATEGAGYALTPILEPLAPYKDRMLVIGGLAQNQAAKQDGEIGGDHPRACTAFLTGSHARMTSGADLRAGISVDQVAAQELKKHTQLASLEVGMESSEVVGACESAYSCAYYNTISWLNETTPLPMENRPRVIFERMFGDSGTTDPKIRMKRMQENKSILDAVVINIKRLREKLPASDRGKIDQYLDAIRDVERRIQVAEVQSDRDLPEMTGPVGTPKKFSDYYKLMVDLQVLAWQSDMTRVCTFQIGHEMSNRAYPELGFGDSHHSVTHHLGDKEKIAKTTQINIFHTKMLSYYLDKLQSTQDGDGSLLDHSMLMYGGALSDGNLHIFHDLPILLFADGIKGIKGGMHVKYPSGTPLNNLYLTMLDKAGIEVEKLGDSTGKLSLPTV